MTMFVFRMGYFETSASTGENFDEAIHWLVHSVRYILAVTDVLTLIYSLYFCPVVENI